MLATLRPLPGVGVVVEGSRHHKGGRVRAGNRHNHDCDDDHDHDHDDNYGGVRRI